AVAILEERLQREVQREQLQTKIQDLERSLVEARAAHEASQGGVAEVLREAAARSDAERLALELRWQQEHQEYVHEAEQRLAGQGGRAAADWQVLKEEMETAQRQFNQERGTLEGELARLRQEAEALRQQRDRLDADRLGAEERAAAKIAGLTQDLE